MLVLQRHTLTLCALSRDAQSDLRRAAGIAENVPVSMDNNPVWRHVSLFTATGNLVDVDQVSMLSKNVSGLLDRPSDNAGDVKTPQIKDSSKWNSVTLWSHKNVLVILT